VQVRVIYCRYILVPLLVLVASSWDKAGLRGGGGMSDDDAAIGVPCSGCVVAADDHWGGGRDTSRYCLVSTSRCR